MEQEHSYEEGASILPQHHRTLLPISLPKPEGNYLSNRGIAAPSIEAQSFGFPAQIVVPSELTSAEMELSENPEKLETVNGEMKGGLEASALVMLHKPSRESTPQHGRKIYNEEPSETEEEGAAIAMEIGIDAEDKIEKVAASLHEIFVEGCSCLYSDIIAAMDQLNSGDHPYHFPQQHCSCDHRHRQHQTLESQQGMQLDGDSLGEVDGDLQLATATTSYTTSSPNVRIEGGSSTAELQSLGHRHDVLLKQADQLVAELPRLTSTVQLRMMAIGRAMEQLRIKQEKQQQQQQEGCFNRRKVATSISPTITQQHLPSAIQFRKWLQSVETELEAIRQQISSARYHYSVLSQLRANQQVLQLQIETEGRALHTAAQQQLRSIARAAPTAEALLARDGEREAKSKRGNDNKAGHQQRTQRWQCNLETLEHRWRATWLTSLESLELINHLIEKLESSAQQDDPTADVSELEDGEPVTKRRRAGTPPHSPPRLVIVPSEVEASSPNSNLKKMSLLADTTKAELNNNDEEGAVMAAKCCANAMMSLSPPPADPRHSNRSSGKKAAGQGCHSEREEEAKSSASGGKRRLYDVGYSSGENSVHEALNNLVGLSTAVDSSNQPDPNCANSGEAIPSSSNAGGEVPDSDQPNLNREEESNAQEEERELRDRRLMVASYYRTVPLDDAGTTDTELLGPSPLVNGQPRSGGDVERRRQMLSDSLVVNVDENECQRAFKNHDDGLGTGSEVGNFGGFRDDFDEVMEMMNMAEKHFDTQMHVLRGHHHQTATSATKGTQWSELNPPNSMLLYRSQRASKELLSARRLSREIAANHHHRLHASENAIEGKHPSDASSEGGSDDEEKSVLLNDVQQGGGGGRKSHQAQVPPYPNCSHYDASNNMDRRGGMTDSFISEPVAPMAMCLSMNSSVCTANGSLPEYCSGAGWGLGTRKRRYQRLNRSRTPLASIFVVNNNGPTTMSGATCCENGGAGGDGSAMSRSSRLHLLLNSTYPPGFSSAAAAAVDVFEEGRKQAQAKLSANFAIPQSTSLTQHSGVLGGESLYLPSNNQPCANGRRKLLYRRSINHQRPSLRESGKRPTSLIMIPRSVSENCSLLAFNHPSPSVNSFLLDPTLFPPLPGQPEFEESLRREEVMTAARMLPISRSYHLLEEVRRGSMRAGEKHHEDTAERSSLSSGDEEDELMAGDDLVTPRGRTVSPLGKQGGCDYEWDEYKDPVASIPLDPIDSSFAANNSHNNNSSTVYSGEPLLSSTLIDEDFQRQLGQHSPGAVFSGIGGHHHQDALQRLLHCMLEQSLKRLAAMEVEFHQVKSKKGAKARRRLEKMKNGAEAELQRLSAALGDAATAASTSDSNGGIEADIGPHIDMEQISEMERLLEKWSQLTARIDMELVPDRQELIPYSDETEVPVEREGSQEKRGHLHDGMEGDGSTVVSLHSVLEEMKKQLALLKDTSAAGGAWSLEEIGQIVEARKKILSSLLMYRDDLQQLTDEAGNRPRTPHSDHSEENSGSSTGSRAEINDLLALVEMVERSLRSIEVSNRSLERLQQGFSALCHSVRALAQRVEHLEKKVKATAKKSRGARANMQEDECLHSAVAIQQELELCQERMDTLETMCNLLSLQLSGSSPSHVEAMEQEEGNSHPNLAFVEEFLRLKEEFHQLKAKFERIIDQGGESSLGHILSQVGPSPLANGHSRMDADEEMPHGTFPSTSLNNAHHGVTVGTQSEVSASTIATYKRRMQNWQEQTSSREVVSPTITSGRMVGNGTTTMNGLTGSPTAANGAISRSQQTAAGHEDGGGADRSTRLVLGSLLFLAVGWLWYYWLMGWMEDDQRRVNHWRWQFGPQLDYLRGPPPT